MAVEFALLMPLLVMFLFGIIQYGYGLYQFQAFSSAMNDVSRWAATGITSCSQLTGQIASLVSDNGLPVDPDHPLEVKVTWLSSANGTPVSTPQRLGWAELQGTYKNPMNLNIPMVPFPKQFVSKQRVLVQDVVTGITDNLANCPLATGVPGA